MESECRETNPRKRSGSHNNSVRAVDITGMEQVLRSTPRVSFHPLLHKTCAVTNTLRIGLCGCVVTVVPNVLVRNRCIVGRTPILGLPFPWLWFRRGVFSVGHHGQVHSPHRHQEWATSSREKKNSRDGYYTGSHLPCFISKDSAQWQVIHFQMSLHVDHFGSVTLERTSSQSVLLTIRVVMPRTS